MRAQDIVPGTGNVLIRFELTDNRDYVQPDDSWNAVESQCFGDLEDRTSTFSIDARECATNVCWAFTRGSISCIHLLCSTVAARSCECCWSGSVCSVPRTAGSLTTPSLPSLPLGMHRP